MWIFYKMVKKIRLIRCRNWRSELSLSSKLLNVLNTLCHNEVNEMLCIVSTYYAENSFSSINGGYSQRKTCYYSWKRNIYTGISVTLMEKQFLNMYANAKKDVKENNGGSRKRFLKAIIALCRLKNIYLQIFNFFDN